MKLLLAIGILLIPLVTTAGGGGILGLFLQEKLSHTPAQAAVPVDVVLHDEWEPELGVDRIAWIQQRQADVLATLPEDQFTLTQRYVNLVGFAGVASRRAIRLLSADPRVARIALDARGRLDLAQGVPLIGADSVHSLGISGAGINVAIVDTGVDAADPDLTNSIVAEECFCSGGCCPGPSSRASGAGSALDTDGHGTALAGIITSDGISAGPGVAHDAGIVALKVGAASGSISLSDVGAALDWLLTNHTLHGVRVVNISITFGPVPLDDPSICAGLNNTAIAIAALHVAGVVVFASSGNSAWTTGIGFPACVPEAVAVGAVYDADFGSVNWGICNDATANADTFTCVTNSGTLLALLAPGWQTATVGTTSFGGTSAASAYAAGQAALLLEADGQCSPQDILDLLTQSGPLVENPATNEFFPRSDVSQALAAMNCSPEVPMLSVGGLLCLGGLLLGTSRLALRRARGR